MIEYVIMSESERNAAREFDSEHVAVGGRLIDGLTPGYGVNLNPNATGFGAGDPVPLEGKYVASKAIVDDPEYLRYAPEMVALLSALPSCELDSDVVFVAPEAQ
jgi:hypothetical protein